MQDSPPVAALNTSGPNNVHSYAYAFKLIRKYGDWSLQKLNAKEELRSRTAKVSGRKKARFNFDFSACLGDDVTQNVSARHCARETQLFLA